MKTYRTSFLRVAAFFMLLCLVFTFSRTATACPLGFSGPTSFTAVLGSSQSQTWTAIDELGADIGTTANITAGSDVFSIDRSQLMFPGDDNAGDTANFTVTFTPGVNATGTFTGTLTCGCGNTYKLVGTVAGSAGVANALPSNVSFMISPNPATDNVTIMSSGVLTAEIGIYNLLGNEIASSNTTTWQWDASSIPTGSYFVRIAGESNSGEQFVIWRRIIIAR